MIYYSKQIRINYDADNTNDWRWDKLGGGMPWLDHIFLEDQIKIVASFLQPVNIFPHKYLNIFLGSPGLHCYAITNIFQVNFNKQCFRKHLKVKIQKTHKKSWGILFRMSEQSRIFFLYLYLFSERNHRWKISIRRRYNFEWTTPAKSI